MSLAAAISVVELLEEECLQVQDTVDQVRRRCLHVGDHGGSIAHLNDGEVIALVERLLLEIGTLEQRYARVCSGNVLSVEKVQELSPTSRPESLERLRTLAREYEATCWVTRVEHNRLLAATLRSRATEELAELEAIERAATDYGSVQLLSPELPSAPGSGCASRMSLTSLQQELAALYREGHDEHCSIDVEDTATRHLQKLRRQVDLQFESRYLEGKCFENEPDVVIRATAKAVEQKELQELRECVAEPQTQQYGDGYQRTLYARQKWLHAVDGGPRLVPGAVMDFRETEATRSILQRDISSCNALEGFQGYIKDSQKMIAQLNVVGGLAFEVVSSGDYLLGKQDPLQPFSLYTPAGSVDHEARLDRRTLYWLLSGSSKRTDGLGCVDGPPHHVYCTTARTLRPHAYYVSKEPITVQQFARFMADRRFGNALHEVVSFDMTDLQRRPRFTPTLFNGEVNGYTMEYEARGSSAVDDALEVPYFVAERICEVLGGIVCPYDIWEAGGRGVDDPTDARRSFLFTEHFAHKKLVMARKAWSTRVDGGSREVFGESMRLRANAAQELSNLRTPFRLERYGRLGCEWNSVLSVNKAADEKRREKERLRCIVSRTPEGVSILQPAEGEKEEGTVAVTAPDDDPAVEETDPNAFPSSCVFQPTSHVLRSLSDYGTQLIVEPCTTATEQCDGQSFQEDTEFLPDNHLAFLGMSLPTFGLPNSGGFCPPVAAFRLAFPVFPDGFASLQAERARRSIALGRNVNFIEWMEGLGREQRHIEALKGVTLSQWTRDPLYGTTTLLLPAAGVSLTFAAGHPNVLTQIDLYAAHSFQRLRVVEQATFGYPIATDSTPPFSLPLQGRELDLYLSAMREIISKSAAAAAAAGGGVQSSGGGSLELRNDSDALFSFRDILTLPWPPGRHVLMGPLAVPVELSLHITSLLDANVNVRRAVTHLTITLIQ